MKRKIFKKTGIFLPLLLVVLIAVPAITLSAQKNNNGNNKNKNSNQPKVDIKVHRNYDKNGNVVGYDSTYSWSWSSNGMPSDSVMQSMQKNLGMNFSFNFPDDQMFGPGLFDNDSIMGQIAPNDSLLSRGFGNLSGQSGQSMEEYLKNMDKRMQQMFGDQFNGDGFFKQFQQKPLIPGVKNDSIPKKQPNKLLKQQKETDNYNIVKT